jgi:putative tryptophan/tyrosine transport system substrate-binding protein
MNIATLLITLVLTMLAAPLAAPAQPAAKIPRVGVLRPGNPPPGDVGQREAFEGGLRDLGWTPGTSLLIEYRYGQGQPERLPELAAELVQLSVDVIVASAPVGVRAAQHATRTIPIVMSTLPDPVREGFVASLARPGGNTTGVTLDTHELAGKQLELLKEAVPYLSRVAVLRNPTASLSGWEVAQRQIEATARALKIELQDFLVSRPEDLAPTFVAMRQAEMGAMLVRRDVLVINRHVAEVVALAATFVDKMLKGAKPANLPVEQPTTFELVRNLKTAQALDLTIPPTLLFQAEEVLR